MEKKGLRIGLAVGIVLIFFGTSIAPGLQGKNETSGMLNQSNSSSADWWPMFHHDLTHSGYSTSLGPIANHVSWVYQTDMQILSCPIVADGKVIFGSNHKYYCLNADTGGKIWECLNDGWAEGNPAYENGYVYLVSRDQYGQNKIFCLNADTGRYLWNYTDCFWPFNPVVYDGMVFFGSLDGYVRCLDALDGSFIWNFSTNSVGISNAPAISDDKVYFGAGNGRMYCLDAFNGNEIWEYLTGEKIMESASIADGKIYFGSGDYNMYCLDAETGQYIWSFTTGFVVDSTPAIAYGKIFFGSRDATLYCLDAGTGQLKWSYAADGEIDSSPAIADGKVYVGSDDGRVYCFDAGTGAKIWDYTTGSYVMSSPAIANGKIYVGSYDTTLYCLGGVLIADFTWLPSEPTHGQGILFNASTSYDSNGYISLYEWDWDYNGVYEESSTTPTTTHLWSNPGSYTVTLRVTNNSGWTDTVTKTITVGNQPPNPPSISGPAAGTVRTATEYILSASDPDGDNLSYYIDWGDGKNTGWIGPYASGEEITQSHMWLKKGTYNISARAKDIFGMTSGWGTLQVTMPLSYEPPHVRFFEWVFNRFPYAFPLLRQLLGY